MQSVPCPAGLAWTRLPRLSPQTVNQIVERAREQSAACGVEQSEGMTVWLRHAVNEHWIEAQAVIDAVNSQYVNRAVWRLVSSAEANAAAALNKIAAAVAGREEQDTDDVLLLRFIPSSSYNDAYCSVATTSVSAFSLPTLNRLPLVLARLVSDTLNTIAAQLLSFATPAELWGGSAYGWYDELQYEVKQAIAAGALHDPQAVIDANGGRSGFDYLSNDPVELVRDLRRYRMLFCQPPRWITKADRKIPVARLRARAHECALRYEHHPWVGFVERACAALDQYSLGKTAARRDGSYNEGEIPLGYGLAADSGSAAEEHVLSDLHDQMMNSGDIAAENFVLNDIPLGALGQRLAAVAAALGLLLLAQDADKSTSRRRLR